MANILTSLKTNIDRIADAVEGGVTPTPTPTPSRTLVIPEQTVTTENPGGAMDLGAISELSNVQIPENYAGPLYVTLNGTDYEVTAVPNNPIWTYPTGATHENFEFAIYQSALNEFLLNTPTAGTYTISAYIEESEEEQTNDFTTAEVTVFNNKKNKVILVLPQVYDDQIYVSDDYQNGTYTVPLYKGQLILQAIALTSETYTTNVTGSIIKDANEFIITGDGGIQIGVAPSQQ